jgi:methylglyoxal synthase
VSVSRSPGRPHRHDVDVEALPGSAVVHDIPTTCDRALADYKRSSPLPAWEHERLFTDFGGTLWRHEPSTTA